MSENDSLSYYRDLINNVQKSTEEYDGDPPPNNVNTVKKLIMRDCSDIVKSIKTANRFLYRGFKDGPFICFLGTIRTNRKPLTSNNLCHVLADKVLASANIETNRSNSLFCTGYKGFAAEFGKLHYVFPFNGFKYLWSEKHQDGIVWVDSITHDINREIYHIIRAVLNKIIDRYLHAIFYTSSIKNESVTDALVTIRPKFYNFNPNHNIIDFYESIISAISDNSIGYSNRALDIIKNAVNDEEIRNILKYRRTAKFLYDWQHDKNSLPDIFRHAIDKALIDDYFIPSKQDIEDCISDYRLHTNLIHAAMQSDHEIMISNCKYYAFSVTEYKDIMQEIFGIED